MSHLADLSKAFADQGVACGNLGSPFMARLCAFLSENWPTNSALAQRCAQFTGDLGPASVSVPLRVAGGLHAARLQDDDALAAIYPPNAPDDETFGAGILAALQQHDDFLTDWVEHAPQTNELRRSVALIPGAHFVAKAFNLPIWLSELGASGGLNLMWDQFSLAGPGWKMGPHDAVVTLSPDWTGNTPDVSEPKVAERRGVDLNPLDPTQPDDLLRMTAYLWPDQPYRLEMTRAAAGAVPAPVDQDDAIDWLERRLEQAPDGHVHLIQNTVAWQYFPQNAQKHGLALLEQAGAIATVDKPMAWLQLETDGDLHALGGGLISLRIWPNGDLWHLGRADFHGRWVRWDPKRIS